ncbi:unnamed protein product [Gadus morhua 'NCC']
MCKLRLRQPAQQNPAVEGGGSFSPPSRTLLWRVEAPSARPAEPCCGGWRLRQPAQQNPAVEGGGSFSSPIRTLLWRVEAPSARPAEPCCGGWRLRQPAQQNPAVEGGGSFSPPWGAERAHWALSGPPVPQQEAGGVSVGRDSSMQHPLAGGACVALPGGDAPQLSCAALTFMYLQQAGRGAAVLQRVVNPLQKLQVNGHR